MRGDGKGGGGNKTATSVTVPVLCCRRYYAIYTLQEFLLRLLNNFEIVFLSCIRTPYSDKLPFTSFQILNADGLG